MVQMLREAGAAEVHMRVSSPPYKWPCFYGIDTGNRSELLAADMSLGEIRDYLSVDSVAYLTIDRLRTAIGAPGAGFCTACLTGEYPTEVDGGLSKSVLEHPGDRTRAGAGDR
jgi:amidophosphoribosyltransferase